jgi:hypothetical protein
MKFHGLAIVALLAAFWVGPGQASGMQKAPSSGRNRDPQHPKQDVEKQLQDIHRLGVSIDCLAAATRKAKQQFQTEAIRVRGNRVRGAPGSTYPLAGTIEVRGGPHQGERFPFSCALEGPDGPVRSVEIGPPFRALDDPMVIRDPW